MSSRNDARVPYPVNGGTQSVAYTGTHGVIANAVGAQTRRVLVYASSDCHIQFASAPVATTADMFLPATSQIFLSIRGGEKVSAIQATDGGTLYVSEMTY